MIARLEKIDQLTQEYHLEKAAGFFVSQIQKKRFIRELWKKRDEDEVKKLGVATPNQIDYPPMLNTNLPPNIIITDANTPSSKSF